METAYELTAADVAYIEENYMCLRARPANGPAASYVLADGSAFYPADYFDQEMDESRFKARLSAEMRLHGDADLDPGEVWNDYLTGIYGVCLKSATPENIVRKNALLRRIESLTQSPDPTSAAWVRALKDAVDALDALERPFSPHYDRARFGKPPTRDSHIGAVRRRFPQIA